MKKILTVIGTRPEVIKMAHLIKLLNNSDFEHIICSTGQHKELLSTALKDFNIIPNINLDIMTDNQALPEITSNLITKFTEVLKKIKPDYVLVHGDTTTSFACALAAFYCQIPVAHIEAGLRTFNKYSPFPEEINRTLTAKLATLHFSPTKLNKINLLLEGIEEKNIFITGNTVIDVLLKVSNIQNECPDTLKYLEEIINKDYILITGHRRENFGSGFKNICTALLEIANKYPKWHIIYPVHLNPNVKTIVNEMLGKTNNIHLIEPQSYFPFVYLMNKCKLIITDSGGIQEEAPSLNKPVLVMREFTERLEAMEAGTIELVGTNIKNIVDATSRILESNKDIVIKDNPYGDGMASERIIQILKDSI
jgi:UDP-N-acetylglucosamine 2-epimerase (non-hydrolysing)